GRDLHGKEMAAVVLNDGLGIIVADRSDALFRTAVATGYRKLAPSGLKRPSAVAFSPSGSDLIVASLPSGGARSNLPGRIGRIDLDTFMYRSEPEYQSIAEIGGFRGDFPGDQGILRGDPISRDDYRYGTVGAQGIPGIGIKLAVSPYLAVMLDPRRGPYPLGDLGTGDIDPTLATEILGNHGYSSAGRFGGSNSGRSSNSSRGGFRGMIILPSNNIAVIKKDEINTIATDNHTTFRWFPPENVIALDGEDLRAIALDPGQIGDAEHVTSEFAAAVSAGGPTGTGGVFVSRLDGRSLLNPDRIPLSGGGFDIAIRTSTQFTQTFSAAPVADNSDQKK
ncbi:MAG: hypothetical protein V1495_01590, partial [Pseudomonadota bacterium]